MRKTIKRANSILLLFFGVIFAVLTILGLAVWTLTFHPADIQPAPVSCMDKTGVPKGGETIKVLSWNVQYMAGKGHCFFYEGGTDKAPTETEVIQTLNHAARVIKIENPDMILLQEIDEGAKRSHYMDQLKMLCERLDGMYPCRSEAFYWKAGFVPHPDIMGAVGMKLVILSKYRISAAKRYQLPLIPENWLFQQFNLKRALLEVRIPFGEHELIIMNTHLSAFAQGTDTMEKQIAAVKSIIKNTREKTGHGLPAATLTSCRRAMPIKRYRRSNSPHTGEKQRLNRCLRRFMPSPAKKMWTATAEKNGLPTSPTARILKRRTGPLTISFTAIGLKGNPPMSGALIRWTFPTICR